MDVTPLLERVTEPAITALVRVQLDRVDDRMSSWQREQLLLWNEARPFGADALNAVRNDVESAQRLRERAKRFRFAAGGPQISDVVAARIAEVAAVVVSAASKPAVASALVWSLLASTDEDLAAHLIQIIRERAGLPRVTSKPSREDPELAAAAANVPALVTWFSDRQVSDACALIEAVPVPYGPEEMASLATQSAAIADARTTTPRVAPSTFAAFARRVAAFLVELSTRKLDPLGFTLGREVQLESDPPLARRVELCAWARRAGHTISPRGALLVLAIPIEAPWPWCLELVAAEPGHGASGCLAILLRIASERAPVVTARAPALLLVPDEIDAERGARFERWLAAAYPHATSEWRAWM